ncbi:Fun26 [Kluyveromyces lactis]|nr:Fun26 [Kluyveromyces lactis]
MELEENDETPITGTALNDPVSQIQTKDLSKESTYIKLTDTNYLAFFLIGIALLWPWNSFLSASLYFQHDVFQDTSVYARIYISTMMTVSTISSVLSNIILSKIQHHYTERIVSGLFFEIIVFTSLCGVVLFHRWLSHLLSFIMIMFLVLVSSVATALSQTGVMAMANVFGPEYNHAVMVGQAVAGVLPSLVLFMVSIFNQKQEQTATGINLYFLSTSVMSFASIVAYKRSDIPIIGGDMAQRTADEPKVYVPFKVLFLKLRYLVLSIFTIFCVTLIFPVFASNTYVVRFPLRNSEFIPFIFMLWNIGDLVGRIIAEHTFNSKMLTPRKIFIYSQLRILMVAVFFLFNVRNIRKNSHLGVFLDLSYSFWQFMFGLTNGLLASCSFMNVGRSLDTEDERKAAGGITNVFLSIGLASGSVISYLFAYIISQM